VRRYGRAVPSQTAADRAAGSTPNDPTPADSTPADSTLTDLRSVEQNTRGHTVRRVTIGVLALIVLLGALGVFGERTGTVRTSAGGYQLSVHYGVVSRAGIDTPWQVTVHHAGGFDGPITLATTASYFEMFESQGLTPAPDSETVGAVYQYQEFSPPPGDTFTLTYDAYIQPASQHGHSAVTKLLINGREVAQVSYRTRLVP
jgi:hypothetical protein